MFITIVQIQSEVVFYEKIIYNTNHNFEISFLKKKITTLELLRALT